jgi:SOS-response transcriptional repressor LexA
VNVIQQKLLDLARVHDLRGFKRTELVSMVGCDYPSQITHHMNQLIKRGDLVLSGGKLIPSIKLSAGFFTIPVLGEADCGEATKFADGTIIDNIVVSPSFIKTKHPERLYSLIARGDSMNKANVAGENIEDGDFVLVEKIDSYMPNQDDIVVSNIGGLANIKRFHKETDRVVLLPDSYRDDYYPIFIDQNDEFLVEGKVVGVVKAVRA